MLWSSRTCRSAPRVVRRMRVVWLVAMLVLTWRYATADAQVLMCGLCSTRSPDDAVYDPTDAGIDVWNILLPILVLT